LRRSVHQALEQAPPVGAADERVDQVLGMRHQPEHVEMLRINPGDGIKRAVAVGVRRHGPAGVAVAEGDAAVAFEPAQGFAVGEIIALAVRHAHLEGLARPVRPRKDRIGALHPQVLNVADEAQVGVAHQHAGQ
jgi:hypothetical protein